MSDALSNSHQYNYVVTAQKPTSVRHSLVGCFTGPGILNLIISKCTRLEISSITAEGLQGVMDVPIYGRISAMLLFPVAGEPTERLFILTEKYRFAVLKFDPATGELVTCANGDASDRIGRPVQAGQMCIVSPNHDVIVLHLYDGHLKVIPVDAGGALSEAFNIKIDELTLIDMCFLDAVDFEGYPTLAVLFEDTSEQRHAKTYSLSVQSKELLEFRWAQANLDEGSNHLIPVKGTDGVLVLGESTIVFLGHNVVVSTSIQPTIIKAYGAVDKEGTRFLLGDYQGRLYLLLLQREELTNSVRGLHIERIGNTSQPSTISYLDSGVVYIGSSCGDSQLIRLCAQPPDPLRPNSFMEVLDTTTNLGPIVDFCVVDLDRQGQGQVVTCSGGAGDGTLRVVRSGVGVVEQTWVELPRLRGIWNLRRTYEDEHDALLVLGFTTGTTVLGLNAEEELEELEVPGLNDKAQTLWCGTLLGSLFCQVTRDAVHVLDSGSLQQVSQWTPPAGTHINLAASNATQASIAVATGFGKVFLLTLERGQLKETAVLTVQAEVSCLDISPLEEAATHSDWMAVGTWSNQLQLYALPSLKLVADEALGGDVIPRSVLITHFGDVAYLFCGMGDGQLVNYRMVGETLTDRKRLALGTMPVKLRALRSRGVRHVFCASDRPTIIHANNQKLVYSNLNENGVNFMVSFHTPGFPNSLALAKDNGLMIGVIDDIQKLHIRTVPLGEQPRRIAHQAATRSYGVITTQATMGLAGEVQTDALRLVDDQTLETLDRFQLEPLEMACSLTSTSLGPNGDGPYYIVGTAHTLPTERESSSGRILVLEARDGKLALVYSHASKGAVYALAPFQAGQGVQLLAGVNARVQLYTWWSQDDGQLTLFPVCSYAGNVLALYLDTRGELVLVGDLMKSMQVLHYSADAKQLELRARDFKPMWMTAVKALDDDTYIGGENSYNLFVLHKNVDAASDEERARLEVVGQFHIGEFVNRFQTGSLVMKLPDSGKHPELSQIPLTLFGTINGVLGLLASLPKDKFVFLDKLQTAMRKVVKGVGGLDHAEWRSFTNQHTPPTPASGFVDGDLIEQFLDLRRGSQELVLSHLKEPVVLEDVVHLVEDLSRLH